MNEVLSRKKADSTVARIIDAAEQLFADNSYEGTTLREIAKQVGIREPSIYTHFANKEAIYSAVIDRALLPFYQEINQWNTKELTLNALFNIPRHLLLLHAAHPYSARILHREFCNPRERISPKVLEWLEQIADQSQVFMAGLPDGSHTRGDKNKVITNLIALTHLTLGYFSSQGMQQALLRDKYENSELFEEHVKLVTSIFKGLLLN